MKTLIFSVYIQAYYVRSGNKLTVKEKGDDEINFCLKPSRSLCYEQQLTEKANGNLWYRKKLVYRPPEEGRTSEEIAR